MRADLMFLCANVPNGRKLAISLYIRERTLVRVEAAKLDPNDWDLNPHLQVVEVANLIVRDLKDEGFNECTREEVYLSWLTNLIFNPKPA